MNEQIIERITDILNKPFDVVCHTDDGITSRDILDVLKQARKSLESAEENASVALKLLGEKVGDSPVYELCVMSMYWKTQLDKTQAEIDNIITSLANFYYVSAGEASVFATLPLDIIEKIRTKALEIEQALKDKDVEHAED